MHTSPGTDTLVGGRYRLGEVLGQGGMAEVYDAIDERLGRRVAVKILLPQMAAREDVRRRFESEARAAAGLSHPNVVTVFDTGEDAGVPWLVMERLPGVTLGDYMGPPIDPEWMRRVAGDVLGALGAAHAAGIVHRDIKPGNILIGSDGCAKVADFGIAKSLEGADDHTVTGQVIGTPAYLAPERIDGEPATVHADLYALGVVLYEALSGRKPFTGDTPVSVAHAVRNGSHPGLDAVQPGLPRDLVATTERAMLRNPADRFSSAAEMARALRPADDTIVLGAIEPRYRHERAQKRRTWVGAGAAALVLVVLLVSVVLLTGQSKADALPSDLRNAAAAVAVPRDGVRAGDAAARLRSIAGAIDHHDPQAAVASQANAFLTDLANWRARGELSVPVVDRLHALALRIPGASSAAFAATTTTTTTAPVQVVVPEDLKKRKKDNGDNKQD